MQKAPGSRSQALQGCRGPSWVTTEHVAKSYQTLAFSTVRTKREIAREHALCGAGPQGCSPKRGFSASSGAGLGQPGRTAEQATQLASQLQPSSHTVLGPQGRERA